MKPRHMATLAFVTISLLFFAILVLSPFVTEPYPAPLGPSFAKVLDGGDHVVIETVIYWGEDSRGRRFPLRPAALFEGIEAPHRFVAGRWIEEKPFDSPEALTWLRDQLEKTASEPLRGFVIQRVEWSYDKAQRRLHAEPVVLDELRIPL